MGCCGSKDTEEAEERAQVPPGNTGSRVQPGVGKVYCLQHHGIGHSLHHNEQRHVGSRAQQPVGQVYHHEDYGIGRSVPQKEQRHIGSRVQAPVVEVDHQQADRIGHSAHHNEERHFFQLFFTVMDHIPGHQGILRRWEREDQQAEFNNGGRCEMGKVWLDGSGGYVKSLQRVKLFVANKKFSSADRLKLTEWAMKVVKRRTKEYNAAAVKGKADPKHLKALDAWRGVKDTLQNLP